MTASSIIWIDTLQQTACVNHGRFLSAENVEIRRFSWVAFFRFCVISFYWKDEQKEVTAMKTPTIHDTLRQILLDLGFQPKLVGYHFLCAAIPYFAQERTVSMKKEL